MLVPIKNVRGVGYTPLSIPAPTGLVFNGFSPGGPLTAVGSKPRYLVSVNRLLTET